MDDAEATKVIIYVHHSSLVNNRHFKWLLYVSIKIRSYLHPIRMLCASHSLEQYIMIVERFPIRDFAADCLIVNYFQTFTSTLVSSLRCS